MARKKVGNRGYVSLECPKCGNRNYRTEKRLRGTPKLSISKYCKYCREHSVHVEKKK